MRRIYFTLQVDCESTQASISNAELGMRAIRGVSDLLLKEGMKATYVVIPKDLKVHGSVYRELRSMGHEIGLHIHPKEDGWEEFLGIYGYDEQREIINHGREVFADALGSPPTCFTPGYFSANDSTFSVLAETGFTHGSVSLPTRDLPSCASVWGNSPRFAHYAHKNNRCLVGSLDFVDVPITVDSESRMWGGSTPQDLRVELVDAKNHYYTLEKAIKAHLAIEDERHVMYLKALTHNIFDYSDSNDFRHKTLRGIIAAVRELCGKYSLELVATDTAGIAEAFRRHNPRSGITESLELDQRGRSGWRY